MLRSVFALAAVALVSPAAFAWDATGHRLIAALAIEGMGRGAPDWIRGETEARIIADGAATPDRWRESKVGQLKHLNDPDHYLDVEYLEPLGLTLETMPRLRYEYVKTCAAAREKGGEGFVGKPVNPKRDMAKTDEWPGFLPYSISEQYAKVQNAMLHARILEELNEPRRAAQLAGAREMARAQMGILAHYVGDAAQPLHTTKHFNGWVGKNPGKFTSRAKFHSYIDGGVSRTHGITAETVRPACDFGKDAGVDAMDPWPAAIEHIGRSFGRMEPLYTLERDGTLDGPEGKAFIVERLADGATTLSALYRAAWESSKPTSKDLGAFTNWDGKGE